MIRALSATLSWANAVRPQNSCLKCPTISEPRSKKYLHLINLLNQYREENKKESGTCGVHRLSLWKRLIWEFLLFMMLVYRLIVKMLCLYSHFNFTPYSLHLFLQKAMPYAKISHLSSSRRATSYLLWCERLNSTCAKREFQWMREGGIKLYNFYIKRNVKLMLYILS